MLNTLARSVASIIELSTTSYSHTSRVTDATTDHMCNCSTTNSNSERASKTTKFTRNSEIQLTHTQNPSTATNYGVLMEVYGYTTDYCTNRRYAPAPTNDGTRSRQVYIHTSRQRMITEYNYCQYARTRNDAEG